MTKNDSNGQSGSSNKKRKSKGIKPVEEEVSASPIPSTSNSTLDDISTPTPSKKRKVEKAASNGTEGSNKRKAEDSGAEESEKEDSLEAPIKDDEGEVEEVEGEESLSKAAKGKAKKKRKEDQKALENPPAFSFDTRGFKGGRAVQIKDVRDLVLHLLSDEKAQQWLYIANKRNVRKVVVLMIPGITPPTLGVPSPALAANLPFSLLPVPSTDSDSTTSGSQLPIFSSLFSHACPTKAPGEKNKMHSTYQAFTTCPLTGGEKLRREKLRKETGQIAKTTDPTAYLLSHELMTEQAYPVPTIYASDTVVIENPTFEDWKRADGWIEAPFGKLGYGSRKVLGIDCEMCLTEDGSELTRVSIVDIKGTRIFDSLVKPDKPILNYLTRYSGLTEEILENVTTKLSDIQLKLSELIDHNTMLLGHSLECDLRVLKLIHPHVIDTSVIYQHPRGPPFKASLKWLAQKWLKKEIQNSVAGVLSVGGHDSEEDARTCVELLNLKMQKGPGFGEFVSDEETIFERMSRGPEPKTSAVVDHGTPGQWHGAKAKTAIGCSNDDEVLKGMLDSIEGHDFTIGRFMELSHALNWSQPSNAVLGKSSATLPGILPSAETSTSSTSLPPSPPVDLVSLHASINTQITTLHASLPPLTALIIFTGHGDPIEMSRLSTKKAKFDRLWKTVKQSEISEEDKWMAEDDRKLGDEVERCRAGLSFYCVKA